MALQQRRTSMDRAEGTMTHSLRAPALAPLLCLSERKSVFARWQIARKCLHNGCESLAVGYRDCASSHSSPGSDS